MMGSGRTTRMCQEAISLSNLGYAVYIVARNEAHVRDIRNILNDVVMSHQHLMGIKVETPETFS